MNTLTKDALQTLLEEPVGLCVSIYLPTHKGSDQVQQDPIRLRNLLRQAEEGLIGQGLRPAIAATLLQPAHQLVEAGWFRQHQDQGLAVFLAPGLFQYYQTSHSFSESVTVGERFYLRPLLPLLSESGVFYVLALSQNQARLLRCTAHLAEELPLPVGTPTSLAQALQYDDFAPQPQFYSGTDGSPGAVFFAASVGSDLDKDNLLRYCQMLDKGICAVLVPTGAPLVLAGVEYLLFIYRRASAYPHLVPQVLVGNADDLSADRLRERAWALVQPIFEQTQQAALARYEALAGTRRANHDLREIVSAAYLGRIDTLLVPSGPPAWGTFAPGTGAVEWHEEYAPGDTDLLDLTAQFTLRKGGAVETVAREALPAGAPVAALLRY
jgi:hypothetical protein